mmetsp:Transcript_1504/g.162  ORF Transcript_1504/g.162 Transcript_1504/m.162 type:complete len:84 (+) Transcript_1504:62-313(+)
MNVQPLHKQGYGSDLNKYVGIKLLIKLNGRRKVSGTLAGHDKYMNIVLDNAVEHTGKDKLTPIGTTVIRGNSIIMWECLEKVM